MKWNVVVPVLVLVASGVRADQDLLPPDELVSMAIDSSPLVQSFDGRLDAARYRGDQLRVGAHEFTVNAMGRRRDIDGAGHDAEWEVGISRGLRLPGKRRIDEMLGDQGVAIADLQLADARHQVALELLDYWFSWLTAEADLRLATASEQALIQEQQVLQRRVSAGAAARMDLVQLESALAMARAGATQAALTRDQRRRALEVAFPGLPLPERAPLDGEPPDLLAMRSGAEWVNLILDRSHEIGAARALAEQAHALARRARADRIADPTIGLQTLSDRGGDEHAIGITFSWAIGGAWRRAGAAERQAEARVQDSEQTLVEREVRLLAEEVVTGALAARDAWRQAEVAEHAGAASVAALQRAHELGEADLAQLLQSRRLHGEAAGRLERARLFAHASHMRVLIDAHERWIDDGHGDGPHVPGP